MSTKEAKAAALALTKAEFPGVKFGPSTGRREVVIVGYDGRSQPTRRYADELHLAEHLRQVAA